MLQQGMMVRLTFIACSGYSKDANKIGELIHIYGDNSVSVIWDGDKYTSAYMIEDIEEITQHFKTYQIY